MKKIPYKEYCNIIILAWEEENKFPELRRGQTIYNSIRRYSISIAEEIRDSEFDPFYNDSNIRKMENHYVEKKS
jgi:hypothetical protein